MATVTQLLMSDDPAQYSGFSKQKSIWGTPLGSQPARPLSSGASSASEWARKPLFAAAPQPPAAPSYESQFDYLYYRRGAPGATAGAPAPVPGAVGAPGPVGAPSSTSTHSAGSAGSANAGSAPAPPSASASGADDDLIPTAIVVKNIPFAIKKEQLVEVMTQLGLPLPYAFNYHFDNGVFRGLAFANYSTADETAVVISVLNGREIGGRKLRVEYKKMLPLQERERIEREKRERRGQLEEQHTSQSSSLESSPLGSPVAAATAPTLATAWAPAAVHLSPSAPSTSAASAASAAAHAPAAAALDMNDKETLDLYTSLVLFSAQPRSEVTLHRVAPHQHQVIHKLCHGLGLGCEDRDGKIVVHTSGLPSYPSALFPQ